MGTTPLLHDQQCPSTVRRAGREIRRFLRGEQQDFTVPLDLTGSTPFQRQVWRATRHIPYGRVRSYRWIAARVGDARSARAEEKTSIVTGHWSPVVGDETFKGTSDH
ncbi:MAG: MGMT family protein [Nitrospirae bacterium]|nr:MGMT family protein [Nitrospirota bacterium]